MIPPFAGVTLIEYRDRIRLTPYYWYREFVGLGRFKANEVGPQPGEDMHPFFHGIMGNNDIWVVATWHRYEDGREEPINLEYLDPEATKEEAEKCLELAAAIRRATGKHLSGGTVKKRRERLGLTTKRPPGPTPKEG
jgi:hypothetical protein